MTSFSKKINFGLALSLFYLFALSAAAKITDWKKPLGNVEAGTPYSTASEGSFDATNVAEFIGKIIWMGPFLGVPFMIQIVLAGYEWMTAAGDAKKVDEAKKRITNATIGLVLFIGLYVMAVFIINSLTEVTEYGQS